MRSICDSVSYVSRHYKHAIAKLTDPLKKFMQINAFWQYSITKDGHFSIISNQPEMVEFFWDQKLYLGHPLLRKSGFYPNGYYFPHLKPTPEYQRTQGKMREKQFLDQLVIIFRQGKSELSAYCFAPTLEVDVTNELINNLHLLNRYVDYFDKEAAGMAKKSLEFSVDLGVIAKEYFNKSPEIADQMLFQRDESKFLLSLETDPQKAKMISSLTEREKSCIYWLLKGRSASETAKKLFLSPRTVESYLENIKNKCGISKKSDLFDYFVDYIFHFKS